MPSPLEAHAQVEKSLGALSSAIDKGVKDALQEIGKAARTAHMAYAAEVPGADRKFSGTNRYNGGRLAVKVRYEYRDRTLRISPQGPWGLAEGPQGRRPDGSGSWSSGTRRVHDAADRLMGDKVDAEVMRAFRG